MDFGSLDVGRAVCILFGLIKNIPDGSLVLVIILKRLEVISISSSSMMGV